MSSILSRFTVVNALLTVAIAACLSVLPAASVSADAPPAEAGDKAADRSDSLVEELEPTLRDGMSAEQQQSAIRDVLGRLEESRFYSRSVVSPFVFELAPIGKLEDGGQQQRLDLWFVAYGTLADIEDRKMIDDLTGDDVAGEADAASESELPQQARPLSEQEVAERGLTVGDRADGSSIAYSIIAANLLDKVFLTGITQSIYRRSDEAIEVTLSLAPELWDDREFPARWHPLTKGTDGRLVVGDPERYTAAAATIRVTPLSHIAGALLIELHVTYAEPRGWFDGRNLLRSKLPPVLQDSVRKFRRKLAQ